MTQPIEVWERMIGEFRIVVEVIPDEDVDLSYIGDFSDSWAEGAIDRFQGVHNLYPRELRYFIPAFCSDAERERERIRMRKQGYSKHEAYQQGESQRFYLYEQMRKVENGSLFFVGIVATIYFQGVELGSSSVWGVEVERVNEDTLYYEITDMLHGAFTFALNNLDSLKSGYAEKLARIYHLFDLINTAEFKEDRREARRDRYHRFVEFTGNIPTKESVNVN